MKDQFDRVMEKFMAPMAEFKGQVMDSVYFFRNGGSFVFAEGYCHPAGALWGMIIKFPLPGGHIDVFGRPYSWTHREYVDGKLTIVPFDRQLENQFKVAPELRAIQGDKPPYARNFVKFPLSDFVGYFDSRRSMRLLRREYEWVDDAVRRTCDLLKVDSDTTGVTGSMCYGRVEDDIDIVFIGGPEENAAVAGRIRKYLKEHREARVIELGKEWPLRFHFAGTLICPFFRYAAVEQIPIYTCEMKVLEPVAEFEATVSDDLHSYYLPAILGLSGVKRPAGPREEDMELIVYHGAMRGELYRGDKVRLKGNLVEVATQKKEPHRAVLITDIGEVERL